MTVTKLVKYRLTSAFAENLAKFGLNPHSFCIVAQNLGENSEDR